VWSDHVPVPLVGLFQIFRLCLFAGVNSLRRYQWHGAPVPCATIVVGAHAGCEKAYCIQSRDAQDVGHFFAELLHGDAGVHLFPCRAALTKEQVATIDRVLCWFEHLKPVDANQTLELEHSPTSPKAIARIRYLVAGKRVASFTQTRNEYLL
jgi:hypothetical protein